MSVHSSAGWFGQTYSCDIWIGADSRCNLHTGEVPRFSHIGFLSLALFWGRKIPCYLDKPAVPLHLPENSQHGMDRRGTSCPCFPFRTWGTSCISPYHVLHNTGNYSDSRNLHLLPDTLGIYGIFSGILPLTAENSQNLRHIGILRTPRYIRHKHPFGHYRPAAAGRFPYNPFSPA